MKKPRQFRIDVELLKRFDKVNEKLAVNGSEVVRRMIEKYVQENERRFFEMKKDEFLKVSNRKYKVDGYVIQYSDQPNYEWQALVNGELVDVSEYDWEDFDGFVEAVIEEYKKTTAQ